LCIELNEGERVVWEDHLKEVEEEEEEGVEGILKRRNRSAFAEEMFAKLVGEVKGDGTLGKYKVGNQRMGESIEVKLSNGDNLTISMVTFLSLSLLFLLADCESDCCFDSIDLTYFETLKYFTCVIVSHHSHLSSLSTPLPERILISSKPLSNPISPSLTNHFYLPVLSASNRII